MAYSDSYYDWELKFRKKKGKSTTSKSRNSIGIDKVTMKNYLRDWRARNLKDSKNKTK